MRLIDKLLLLLCKYKHKYVYYNYQLGEPWHHLNGWLIATRVCLRCWDYKDAECDIDSAYNRGMKEKYEKTMFIKA